jgi:hypothetical protein
MGRPRFNESLRILAPAPGDPPPIKKGLSVCAMGPIEPGETIISMRVWIIQETDDINQFASSAGEGGVHLGSHPPVPGETFPNNGPQWMVQTLLEPGSAQFTPGKGALATAMAVVECRGKLEVRYWSQGVMIKEPHAHPEGYEGDEPTT